MDIPHLLKSSFHILSWKGLDLCSTVHSLEFSWTWLISDPSVALQPPLPTIQLLLTILHQQSSNLRPSYILLSAMLPSDTTICNFLVTMAVYQFLLCSWLPLPHNYHSGPKQPSLLNSFYGMSCKQNHEIYILLYLALSHSIVIETHLYCFMCSSIIFLLSSTLYDCAIFIYPFTCWWALGGVSTLGSLWIRVTWTSEH